MSVLQVRRQGEADAELQCPVIWAVVSPPPQRRPSLVLVRGGMEGKGRGGTAQMQKNPSVKEEKNPQNSPLGDVGLDTTSKHTQARR